MTKNRLFPVAALVFGIVATGTLVATAQTADTTAEAPGAQAMPIHDENGKGRWGRHGRPGEHGGRHGGPGGMFGGEMMRDLMARIDTDGSKSVTQAEIDTYLAAQLAAADTSKDGTVDLAEFEPVFNAMMRAHAVRAFQGLDADGDGKVTAAELDARFGDAVERMDRNGDGALSPDDRGKRG
jgi:hypothetical protein